MLRPGKEAAIKAAISLTPQYTRLLRDLQKGEGRLQFIPEIASIQNRLAQYVLFYEDDRKIAVSLLLAILGEEEFHNFKRKLESASEDERQQFIEELVEEEDWKELVEYFRIPETPQAWVEARAQFDSLPAEEKADIEKRGSFFWSYFFSNFFNILALMVHGDKLTTLVFKAVNGDDTAFLRALQTDRMLLEHHPYFKERESKAASDGDKNFLMRIATRKATPLLNGQIKYPGLYMVFGILDSFQWLDDLKADEILDICISAGLDQYQNRIDDVNYLRDRLNEYRKWQRIQRMSRI